MATNTNNAVNTSLSGQTGTGEFVGNISPTIVTPDIDQINDTNGNPILGLVSSVSAVNYIGIYNTTTGVATQIQSLGSDTDIGMHFFAKGQGSFNFTTDDTSNQIVIGTGPTSQHTTNLTFPTTAVSQTVNWPDASGTVTLLGNGSTGSGNVVLESSPTIQSPFIDQIVDSISNTILSFADMVPGGNTWVNITNGVSPGAPSMQSMGTGSDLDVSMGGKGIGCPVLFSPNSGVAARLLPNQNSNVFRLDFNIPTITVNRTATWRDSDGTVAYLSDIANLGDSMVSQVTSGTPVTITTATDTDVTNLSLPSGKWMVYGNVGASATLTMTAFNAWVSLTSATMPDASLITSLTGLSGAVNGLTTPSLILTLGSTTTVYLSTNCTFTGTGTAYGQIQAVRIKE